MLNRLAFSIPHLNETHSLGCDRRLRWRSRRIVRRPLENSRDGITSPAGFSPAVRLTP